MPYLIPSVLSPDTFEEVSLGALVTMIKTEHADEISIIRNCTDKAEQKRLKLQLPAFTLAEFGSVIRWDHFISTQYLIYDIDGLNRREMMVITGELKKFAVFWFATPSGKGLKFVIQMNKPLTADDYKDNYLYYLDFFTEILHVELDRSYRAWQTFISNDGGCHLNPEARVFPVQRAKPIRIAQDVNIATVVDGEIDDICDYLANNSVLPYHEYVMVAMALKGLGKRGRELFLHIGKKDDAPDHRHRNYGAKFDSVDPQSITLGTLYWIALQHGYKRKPHFTAEGKGRKCPFDVRHDGMYARKKDGALYRIFDFTSIQQKLCIVNTNTKGDTDIQLVLAIDGYEITIDKRDLANRTSFANTILTQHPTVGYMTTTENKMYDALFNYIGQTKDDTTVISLKGIGRVTENIWNLGNAVIIDGTIIPYERVIETKDHKLYALTETTAINVRTNKRLWTRLDKMFEYYDDWASIALGWAVSSIWSKEIRQQKGGGYPILFIHGRTQTGKTQLANVILSLFGVVNAEEHQFRINMEDTSLIAMSRIKDESAGIPHLFDEYGGRHLRQRTDHFHKLKALYDGIGRTTATKEAGSNQTTKLQIRSGSIIAACARETQPEAVNRCVYINMDGVKDDKDSFDWTNHFQGDGLRDLSGFITLLALNGQWSNWLKEYEKAYRQLGGLTKLDSRVRQNYATVMAGYTLLRELLNNAVIPHLGLDWWFKQATEAAEYNIEADPVEAFISYIQAMSMANDAQSQELGGTYHNDQFPFLQSGYSVDNRFHFIRFKLEPAYIEMKRRYCKADNLVLSPRDMGKLLKDHPWCNKVRPMVIKGMTHYGYELKIPTEEEMTEVQGTVPF